MAVVIQSAAASMIAMVAFFLYLGFLYISSPSFSLTSCFTRSLLTPVSCSACFLLNKFLITNTPFIEIFFKFMFTSKKFSSYGCM